MFKIFLCLVLSAMMLMFNSVIVFYMNLCYLTSFVFIVLMVFGFGGTGSLTSYFGIDLVSFLMVFLVLWIMGLMYMSLLNEVVEDFMLFLFISVMLILILFFSSLNLIVLYFFFEVSLIPTFFIVLYWGMNMERLEAGFYLLMYMMFVSFPLLVFLMKIYNFLGSFDLILLTLSGVGALGSAESLMVFGAFLIKLPIFFFHIWLPKAHVEAPVYGSMLLAAILLKLGGYGLLRLMPIMVNQCVYNSCFIMSVGIIGSMYTSLLSLLQVDMKKLVAYSSIVHMNFMLCSLFTLTKMSVVGSVIMMVSHGLCSSGLFYVVNMYYKRSNSRMLIINKGLVGTIPSMGMGWFLLCVSNFSFPFSINFFGEMFIIMVLVNYSSVFVWFIGWIGMISGGYSLYLFSLVFHGDENVLWLEEEGLVSEYMCVYLHYFPLLIFILNLGVFIL